MGRRNPELDELHPHRGSSTKGKYKVSCNIGCLTFALKDRLFGAKKTEADNFALRFSPIGPGVSNFKNNVNPFKRPFNSNLRSIVNLSEVGFDESGVGRRADEVDHDLSQVTARVHRLGRNVEIEECLV